MKKNIGHCNRKYDKAHDKTKTIHKIAKQPEALVTVEVSETFHPLKKKKIESTTEQKVAALGYIKMGRSSWVRAKRAVHVVRSSKFGRHIRIIWREEWKNGHAIVYDYSDVRGPVCVVPIPVLFASDFVRKKRQSNAYANSGYWWSQIFPINHELSKLVLSFKNRWDIL